MKNNHPKSFVLQFGSLIALYVSITALLILLFGIINLRFPDELFTIYDQESARASIRNSIALLVVFFPAFVVMTRLSSQNRRQEYAGEYTTLNRWLIYISLLLAGGALLGDLVTIIMQFLNGEITTRFILKAFVFFAVVSAAFTYYLLDVKNYFKDKADLAMKLAIVMSIVVIGSLVAGYRNIESPSEVREIKLDQQQVSDLQNIQYRIEEYYIVRNGFPESIDDLYIGETVPKAPEGRQNYRYVLTGEKTYELCATFAHESQDLNRYPNEVFPMKQSNYTWDHGKGEKCFVRIIEDRTI